jgi:uncharacterized membrane protein
MTLESSKNLGGIGAILLFIGVIALFVQPLLAIIGLVGVILILVALHDLASYYKESGIFNNALYGVIAGIVGVVVVVVGVVAVILSSLTDFLYQLYPGWNGDWASLSGLTPNTNIDFTTLYSFFAGIFAVLVILWIFAIIAAFFVRRSLKQVSDKSNVGMFGTAGLLLLIGAIIPVIGLILMWIAVLLLAIAFFNLKPEEQPMATATSPPPPTPV